jgi:hypothetical protein
MKKAGKFILYVIVFIILAVGGILLYQTFGVSESTNWDDKDELELQQEQSTDSVVNNPDAIFD